MLPVFTVLALAVGSISARSFYFATHERYQSSNLNISAIMTTNISGGVKTVKQQCYRLCLQETFCKALRLILLQGDLELGRFSCEFFNLTTCAWSQVALQNVSSTQFSQIWDKLGTDKYRAKPCIETCAAKYRGNCTVCRGYSLLRGPDCDIAPKICSDHLEMLPNKTWSSLPIWPWGAYGPRISASCRNFETMFLVLDNYGNGSRRVASPGLSADIITNDLKTFAETFELIDWPLLAELQAASVKKILTAYVTLKNPPGPLAYNFSGFELSAFGELSLNASLNNSTGFPTPLQKIPFVKKPQGFGTNCGPFWQFEENVSVCEQRTNVLNFGNIKWDGVNATYPGFMALTFI